MHVFRAGGHIVSIALGSGVGDENMVRGFIVTFGKGLGRGEAVLVSRAE